MLGRHDSWRLACFLAKQEAKEPAIFAELEARGISEDGIGEMLALATWAAGVMTGRSVADACDVETALEVAQRAKLIDDRDIAIRRRALVAYA
jgi:hypothetical protein